MKQLVSAAIYLIASALQGAEPDLARRIDLIREELGTPGITVSAVHHGEVVLLHATGVLASGHSERVTPRTRFPLASISKSFTSLALADAVHEGAISWSDKLHDRVDGFRLATPEATLGVSINLAASHQTGMGTGGLLGVQPGISRRELVGRFDRIEMEVPHGAAFIYNNLMYSALGLVFEDSLNQTWEDAIQARVLDPLGMERSSPFGGDPAWVDVARSHVVHDGQWTPKPGNTSAVHGPSPIGPASTVTSTAEDMSKLMLALLNDEHFAGLLADTSEPRSLVRPATGGWLRAAFPDCDLFGYGRGWFLASRSGHRVIFHPGGGGGIATLLLLMPEEDFGITVLSNYDDYAAIFAVAHTVADEVLGFEPTDWVEQLGVLRTDTAEEWAAIEEVATGRPSKPLPPLPLPDYAGAYEHEAFGTVTIEFVDGALRMRRGEMTGSLEHWDRDTFLLTLPSTTYLYDFVTFTVGFDREPMELMVWDQGGFARGGGGH